jgi:pimeloyl-ACP methyl ester carboxylesterase
MAIRPTCDSARPAGGLTHVVVTERRSEQVTDDTTIRPFRVNVPEADLTELRRRIKSTRLPEKEPVSDTSQGVQLATVEKLARYWADEYDWRRSEARINAFPNFVTEIDGVDVHFIHARSKPENALPIIVTHGWPYSVLALLKIIEPLTNPTAHGGTASDAFHVVIPSIPGYGYSGKPATGWGPDRIARAWAVLMNRLGYTRYVAQGGDWGAIITEQMAAPAPPGLIGMHTNMAAVVPPEIDKLLWAGTPLPADLSADEKLACETLAAAYKKIHYALYMAARPQALYAIADSPVGLAAWLIDFPYGLDLIARCIDGVPESLTRDDILENCTLYWLTNTGVSSARLYRENTVNYFAPTGINIPVAVSVFPDFASSIYRRGAGRRRRIRSLSTSTKLPRVVILPRGNSRRSLRTNCAPDSDRCADRRGRAHVSGSSRTADHDINDVIAAAASHN